MIYNGLPQFFEKAEGYQMKWAQSILSEKFPEKMKKRDTNIMENGLQNPITPGRQEERQK